MMLSSTAVLLCLILVTNIPTYKCETVTLSPKGIVSVCPGRQAKFTCRTLGGALQWKSSSSGFDKIFNNAANPDSNLGIFRVSVQGVSKNGSEVVEVNSTAITLDGVQLNDDDTTLSCLVTTNFDSVEAVLKVAGPPTTPNMTSITHDHKNTNNSTLLISWSQSNCAVQYVVTIINSSDDRVYPNITTSNTNTTVTLPTGVKFCVTLVAVDSISRRGSDTTPVCYFPRIPIIYSSSTVTIEVTSSLAAQETVSAGPTVNIAAVSISVILIVFLFITGVGVLVVLSVIICRRKSAHERKEYVYQVFNKKIGVNCWNFICVITPKEQSSVVEYYKNKDFVEENIPVDCQLISKKHITFVVKISEGWVVIASNQQQNVSRVTEEICTGVDDQSPFYEMTVKADCDEVTPSDLSVSIQVKGVKAHKNIIDLKKEAENVMECVCGVFYHKKNANFWKATIAFFPKKHENCTFIQKSYQDMNFNCNWHKNLVFSCGELGVTIDNTRTDGWIVTKDGHECSQTKCDTRVVEQYNGECEPPHVVISIKFNYGDVTGTILPKLSLPVTLTGVKQPTSILLERVPETPSGYVHPLSSVEKSPDTTKCICQVFYHKVSLNCWKVIFAFFPDDKADRVYEVYQNDNIGLMLDNVEFLPTGEPIFIDFQQTAGGWKVTSSQRNHLVINSDKVKEYDCENEPPFYAVTLEPDVNVNSTPSDFKQSITINGIKKPNTLLISRMAEKVPIPNSHT